MDTTLSTDPLRPVSAAACQTAGNWRLDRLPESRTVFLALALSAGVHAVLLLAFNQPGIRIISVIPHPKTTIVEWRPVDEPEPPRTVTEVKELDDPPAVNVPQLPDAPAQVDLQHEFVMPLQPPALRPDINTDNLTRIPTDIPGNARRLDTGGIFELKDVGRRPRAIAQPAPRFPRELQNQGISAELVVEFIVDTSGSVRNATIVSSTHPGFERAALDGVRQWKFQPGMKDGHKVNTRMRQPIRFALENSPGI